MKLHQLLAACVLPTTVLSALVFTIPSSHILASPSLLSSTTKLTLTTSNHTYSAPLRRDGRFLIASDVVDGDYLADVACRDYHFEPLGVTVHENKPAAAWITFRGGIWSNKGEAVLDTNGDIQLRPVARKEYFVERAKFNPADLLKNWMMIGAIASLVMAFGLPYLIENSKFCSYLEGLDTFQHGKWSAN
jgi:hypothetical protein